MDSPSFLWSNYCLYIIYYYLRCDKCYWSLNLSILSIFYFVKNHHWVLCYFLWLIMLRILNWVSYYIKSFWFRLIIVSLWRVIVIGYRDLVRFLRIFMFRWNLFYRVLWDMLVKIYKGILNLIKVLVLVRISFLFWCLLLKCYFFMGFILDKIHILLRFFLVYHLLQDQFLKFSSSHYINL